MQLQESNCSSNLRIEKIKDYYEFCNFFEKYFNFNYSRLLYI